jgi:nucleotide-binding universal stress UspA family protein
MFNKVVWATDGSEAADRSLPNAKGLVAPDGGSLTVIHCEEYTLPGKGGGRLPVHAGENELVDKIKGQVAELSKAGGPAELKVVKASVGGAAHVIADVARAEGADVIVVGTRGHTVLGGLLLGSVTNRLLHVAPCPVLAVPTRDPKADR